MAEQSEENWVEIYEKALTELGKKSLHRRTLDSALDSQSGGPNGKL